MSQAESMLSAKIVRALNARGHQVWKNHADQYSKRGISDITGISSRGIGIAIETKNPGNEDDLSREQFEFLVSIFERGGLAGVISSVSDAIDLVENGKKQMPDMWTIGRKGRRKISESRRLTDLSPFD